jgi:recombination protein RecA
MARGRPKGSKNKSELQKKEINEEVNEMVKENQEIKLTKEQQIRKDKLNQTLREINQNIGKDTVKFANTIQERGRIPFKNKNLTNFCGGGIPRGTYTTIWGSKGCAKTTLVLDLISIVQKENGNCVYINGERSYDPLWAKKRGVDTEKLVVVDVETIEEGLDIVIKLCREKVVDLIVFDSLHSLAPKGEMYEGKTNTEKSVSQDTMALRARKLTQFFEMATAFVANSKCAIVLIGQSRMDLSKFIKIESLTGGHSLLHNSRLILKVRRGSGVDAPTKSEKQEVVEINEEGEKVKKMKIIKTKIGFDLVIHCDKSQLSGVIEGQEIHLPFYYEEGIKEE